MAVKERLDVLLLKKGLAPSRETAKAFIMSGNVYVNGQKSLKSGEKVDVECRLELVSKQLKYVSRGGLKLEKAIEFFALSIKDNVCADIGASTGGFTDCMLQHGAKKVYAVDVGYGQLDWKIRNDDRVTVLEKTNARYINKDTFDERCEFVSVDVSFISLKKILPIMTDNQDVEGILTSEGGLVCLIKPQFECGRKYVGKKGVVKDAFVHEYVINMITENAEDNGLCPTGLTFSPIKGPNGNIEYLMYLIANGAKSMINSDVTARVVAEAFNCV